MGPRDRAGGLAAVCVTLCPVTTECDDLVTVRLLDVPVPLRFQAAEHGEGLVREMTLLMNGDPDTSRVPARLVELAGEVTNKYVPFTEAQVAALEEAFARGVDVVPELVYRVPPSAVEMARRLLEILSEADDYCRAGEHLLTLATPPDVAAFRAWMLGEFERQVAGEPPVPWPEFRASRGGMTPC